MARTCALCQADISGRDWRAIYCGRFCREKAYRENNREPIKRRKAADYHKRRVHVLAKNKEWYQANKSEISLKGKQSRAAEKGIDLTDRCCTACDDDISHRTLNAEYCQTCSQAREQEFKQTSTQSNLI